MYYNKNMSYLRATCYEDMFNIVKGFFLFYPLLVYFVIAIVVFK